MKNYYKEEDGKIIWLNGILRTAEFQIANPSEEDILKAGYTLYVKPEPTLEEIKALKIEEVLQYDNTNSINECFIIYQNQTIPYWASKNERNDLKRSIEDYINAGFETYRLDLRDIGISVEIPCQSLIKMMENLEVYAIKCYNKTTDHIFEIQKLENKDQVESYDYKQGYPEKLVFNLKY